MTAKSFDQRLDRLQWQPGAVPTSDFVDSVTGGATNIRPRGIEATLAGAILGILIGVGLKGMMLPDSPWGPGTGMAGATVGTLALLGLAGSVPLALFAAWRNRRMPRLMQFSSMNLLMIVVLLLS